MVRDVPTNVLEKMSRAFRSAASARPRTSRARVLFLVADKAEFITGSTLSVNGGQHMY